MDEVRWIDKETFPGRFQGIVRTLTCGWIFGFLNSRHLEFLNFLDVFLDS